MEQPIVHTFFAAKGGQGTTVTAVAAALLHARAGRRTLLVDAAEHHDCHAVLGLPEPHDPTATITVALGLDLRRTDSDDASRSQDQRSYDFILVDAGRQVGFALGTTTLVTRACYLALRRALALGIIPDNVVLLSEPGRCLSRSDVEAVLTWPVIAEVPIDAAISRTIDAGLLASRIPAALDAVALATRQPHHAPS